MKRSIYKKNRDDELLDVILLLQKIINQKFLIILITTIFVFIGFFYSTTITKQYASNIYINKIPSSKIIKFYKYSHNNTRKLNHNKIQESNLSDFKRTYDDNYRITFLSKSNQLSFLRMLKDQKNINKIYDMQNYENLNFLLGLFNITDGNSEKKQGNNIFFKFNINYDTKIDGSNLINLYAVYTKDVLLNKFISNQKDILLEKREELTKDLEIAKKINLNQHLFLLENSKNIVNSNELHQSFLMGTEVLKLKLKFLDEEINNLEIKKYDYKPILSKSIDKITISLDQNLILLISFCGGLIFSLFFIFFREIMKV